MNANPIIQATTYAIIVGRILTKRRKSCGLRQEALATALGVTQSTWSRIENGTSALTISQLAIAARALNLPPSDLIAQADEVHQARTAVPPSLPAEHQAVESRRRKHRSNAKVI